MSAAWVSTSSTNVEAMVNSIAAACDQGFIPEHCYFLENPGVTESVQQAMDLATIIVEAYGEAEPTYHLTAIDDEVAFDRIQTHVRDAIEAANERGEEVAVDITPGRKFMSAIAFAAGMRYGADHVFYFYLSSPEHYGRLYPAIPRTASHLYDFTEVG